GTTLSTPDPTPPDPGAALAYPKAPVPAPLRPKPVRSVHKAPGQVLYSPVFIFIISNGLSGKDSRTNPLQEEGDDVILATKPGLDTTDADPAPALMPGREYTGPRPTPAPPPEPRRAQAPELEDAPGRMLILSQAPRPTP
ncbi:hypothetical protein LINPERHAP1_LOCUS9463, partial [Linum perenne]